MEGTPAMAQIPKDKRALIAIDLGAESCRVSLLRWKEDDAVITLIHRFANAPRETGDGLRWDLGLIEAGLDYGLRRCASTAIEGVRSIAVDGWAVDYVRIGANGRALHDPYCYRDERTIQSERLLHRRISPERLRELTGVLLLRINTLYQLFADIAEGSPSGQQWLNVPEYILSRLGGTQVAELTNATHTQMVGLRDRKWCKEIFDAATLDPACAPQIVPPGTVLGRLSGPLAELSAFRDTILMVPACHDTASAIAGIPAEGDDWAYISAGTWSLVGTLLEHPRNGPEARVENFTNLGAIGNRICFHKNVNGMWMLGQCIKNWSEDGVTWAVQDLVKAAEKLSPPRRLLEIDHPDFLLAGRITERIKKHLHNNDHYALNTDPENAPVVANLIFHSMAARYAQVLQRVAFHSGKDLKRLFVVGGASQNEFLNRLTEEVTGLKVFRGSVESSTVGNFATQMASLESPVDPVTGVSAEQVSRWARLLVNRTSMGPINP